MFLFAFQNTIHSGSLQAKAHLRSSSNITNGDDAPTATSSLSEAPPKKTKSNAMVFGPVPNRAYHEGFMRKAIEMAEFALASDETPVGCVFVHKGEIIGRGINGTNASLNVRTRPPTKTWSSTSLIRDQR